MKFKSNRIIPSKETFPIFVNMIENFPFGSVIFELDDGLKILANNKLILKILGFKSQEDFDAFAKGNFLNLVHEDSKEEIKEFLNQFLEVPDTENDTIIFRANTPDGSFKLCRAKGIFYQTLDMGKNLTCYISDVTQESMAKKNNEEKGKLELIATALSGQYETIFLRNLITNETFTLKNKNIETFEELLNQPILEDDYKRLILETTNNFIEEELSKKHAHFIRYRTIKDEVIHWHQIDIIPTSNYDIDKTVIFACSNIDEQIKEELKKVNEDNIKELEKISGGILGEFDCIMFVDSKTYETKILKQNEDALNYLPDWLENQTFQERMRFMANNFVIPNEAEFFLASSSIEKVINALKTKDFYSFNYQSQFGDAIQNWQLRFAWADKKQKNIVFAIKNIDEEIKQLDEQMAAEKERKRQEAFVKLFAEQYVCAFYVNLTTGKYIVYKKEDDIEGFSGDDHFNTSICDFINKRVDPLQKNLMIACATVEGIKQRLKTNEEYSFNLKDNNNGQISYLKMRVMRGHDKDHAAIGFLNVTEEYLKREVDIANERQRVVINILAGEYDAVFYVKCNDDDTFGYSKIYRVNENFKKVFPDWSNYDDFEDFLATYRYNAVFIDDRRMFALHTQNMILFGSLTENKNVSINYRVLTPEDDLLYYEMKLIGDFDNSGRLKGFIAAIHSVDEMMKKEIEDRKKVEKDLKLIEIQKAQLVSQHTLLEKANKAKTDFLFNMSHDIRTPMNAIMGFASLAHKYYDKPEKIKDYIAKIQVSGNHLLKLINEVLDMSRIESGKLHSELKTVRVVDNFMNLYTIHKESASTRDIELIAETNDVENRYVQMDELHIDQIIMNVLGNAIKYTMPGGKVIYSIKEIPSSRDDLCAYQLVIKDNGIGMEKEYLEHIYDAFSRERNSTVSGIEGTGLGMAIVKKLVDYLDGKIDIQSEQGKGTKVTLEFQFLKGDGIDAKGEVVPYREEEFRGLKVLVVEDNPLNQEIAKEFLEEAGFVVDTANDGKEAVDIVNNNGAYFYDFILMDIQMPIMDGYEATREIRKIDGAEHLPIIALSANAFGEDKQKSLAAGMNDHVAKPIQLKQLFESVSKNVLKK